MSKCQRTVGKHGGLKRSRTPPVPQFPRLRAMRPTAAATNRSREVGGGWGQKKALKPGKTAL